MIYIQFLQTQAPDHVHGINFRLIFSGEICLTEQTGGTALTEETLQSAVTLASKQAQEIQQALKALR